MEVSCAGLRVSQLRPAGQLYNMLLHFTGKNYSNPLSLFSYQEKKRLMFKKFLSLLFSICLFLSAYAQRDSSGQKILPDTLYKKILLVPYNPIMHLSDADRDISEYNQENVKMIRTEFRNGLSKTVAERLAKNYQVVSLLANESTETAKELEIIDGSLNYEMDTVFPVSHPADTLQKHKSLFSKNRSSKLKEIHDLKYMNVKLSHPELLSVLSDKYGTDLFVFLNQFEIKTNYDDCLDLAMKIYRRQLKVHYSIFNVDGKQLYGDVVVVDFPSNTNDTREIMKGNFQKIAEYIFKTIPKKKDPS